MPQILHTGQGVYQQGLPQGSSYDPVQSVKQVGDTAIKLAQIEFEVKKQREEDFMKSMDVKTQNFIFDEIQKEGAKKVEDFTNFATDVWKQSNENPTTADKIAIQKKQREVEQWQQNQSARVQEYMVRKETLYKDMGRNLDWDENQQELTNFEKDPMGYVMKKPIMAYPTYYEELQNYYKSKGFLPEKGYDVKAELKGNKKVYTHTRGLIGLENEEKKDFAFEDFWKSSPSLQRTMYRDWKKYNEYHPGEYKNPYEYFKNYRAGFGLGDTYVTEQIVTPPKTTSWMSGGSFGGQNWVFSPQEDVLNPMTNTNEVAYNVSNKYGKGGIPIRLKGKVNLVGGGTLETTGDDDIEVRQIFKDYAVGYTVKGSEEIDTNIQIDDKTRQDISSVGMIGQVYDKMDGVKRKVIKRGDKYYLSKELKEIPVSIDLTKGSNRTNVMNQVQALTKLSNAGSYFKAYSSTPQTQQSLTSKTYVINGEDYTYEELSSNGWSDDDIKQLEEK